MSKAKAKGKDEVSHAAKQAGAAVLALALLVPFSLAISDIYVDPSDPGFGSRDFPLLVAAVGIGLCLLLLARALPSLKEAGRAPAETWRRTARRLGGPLVVALMASLYIWAITLFQYALPTLAMTILLIRYFGGRGAVRTVVVPVIAVALYYLIFFVILGVFEEPGSVLSYDTYSFARALRQMLGLQ
jgi:hypothetical protein